MAGVNDLRERIRMQIRGFRLKIQFGIIACDNAGSIEQHHCRAEIRKILCVFLRIDILHIGFPQICLYHSPRIICPPVHL